MNDAEIAIRRQFEDIFVNIRREMLEAAQTITDNSLAPLLDDGGVSITPTALPFSDDVPEDVITSPPGLPGTTNKISRSDHVHPVDTGAFITPSSLSDSDPEDISYIAASSGVSLLVSRADHVHFNTNPPIDPGSILSLIMTTGDLVTPEIMFDDAGNVMWDA